LNSLILASSSPRRRKLAELLPYSFRFESANCDEIVANYLDAKDFALQLAKRKATTVAAIKPDIPVIGCDTIVVLNGLILGKPINQEQAISFLKTLSANKHEVITAYHITEFDRFGNMKESVEHAELTTVEFGKLSEKQIRDYVNSGSPMDKAGAYGIQDDKGALFVKRIIGDYYNVVGLPLYSLNKSLMAWFK